MKLSVFIFVFLLTGVVYGEVCQDWSTGKKVGQMNENIINESSGLIVSKKFPNRLYHINDSGDGPFFYSTDSAGKNTQVIKINNLEKSNEPKDVEDLAYGSCGKGGMCLYIGDIGDNAEKRRDISIFIIKEKEQFGSSVDALHLVKARYPDGAHNAEGMAMHPDGSLYILTKKINFKGKMMVPSLFHRPSLFKATALPAKLYKLSSKKLHSGQKKVHTLELVMDIDLPYLNLGYTPGGQIATAFDISSDGKKLLVLTYMNFMEISLDLSKPLEKTSREWLEGIDYKVFPALDLPQQEAIAYGKDSKEIFYTTEFHEDEPRGIYRSECLSSFL